MLTEELLVAGTLSGRRCEQVPQSEGRIGRMVLAASLVFTGSVCPSGQSIGLESKTDFVVSAPVAIDKTGLEQGQTGLQPGQQVPDAELQSTGNIGFYNTKQDRSSLLGDAIKSLIKKYDIGVLSMVEVHGKKQRDNLKKAVCDLKEYNCFMMPYTKGGSSPSSYPILWDARQYEQVGKGSTYFMSDGYTDPDGLKISKRYASTVVLRQKDTGLEFVVAGSHAPSGAQRPDGSLKKGTVMLKRLEEFAINQKNMIDKIREQHPGLPIIYMKDGNVDQNTATKEAKALLDGGLEAQGFVSAYDVLSPDTLPITSSRKNDQKVTIDYVYTDGQLVPTKLIVPANKYDSDHKAVIVEAQALPARLGSAVCKYVIDEWASCVPQNSRIQQARPLAATYPQPNNSSSRSPARRPVQPPAYEPKLPNRKPQKQVVRR